MRHLKTATLAIAALLAVVCSLAERAPVFEVAADDAAPLAPGWRSMPSDPLERPAFRMASQERTAAASRRLPRPERAHTILRTATCIERPAPFSSPYRPPLPAPAHFRTAPAERRGPPSPASSLS